MIMTKFIQTILIVFIFAFSVNGQVSKKTFKLYDKKRIKYSCYLPDDYKKQDTFPLVIALHWGWGQGAKAPDFYSYSFLNDFALPVFKEFNPIIIAPDCPADSWINELSVNSILELRDFCIKKYKVDTSKIIIAGFSLGAIGTWYMSAFHPDKFTYAIAIAGYPQQNWVEKIEMNNLYVINSSDDEVIPIEKVDSAIKFLESKNIKVYYKKLYGISHYNTGLFIIPTNAMISNIFKEK